MASLAEKTRNVGSGTGRGVPVPNILAKFRSLTRPKPMLTLFQAVIRGWLRGPGGYRTHPEVATNFSVPAVTVFMFVPRRIEDAVSIELAVK